MGTALLSNLLRRRLTEPTHALYSSIVTQARQPEFYLSCGVQDTLDGRFDLIALHAFLLLRRLRRLRRDRRAGTLAQAVFDLMFADFDGNLRELGVADLGVGRRIKTMATAFYGRVAAYDAGLADASLLDEALRRNLYRGHPVADPAVGAMAAYLRAQAENLDEQSIEALMSGQVRFGMPVPP